MSKANQPEVCGLCHNTEGIYKVGGITKRNLISRYKSSVHWEAIRTGKEGAGCVDCHGHHNILSSAEENSAVSCTRVGNTCMKCHPTQSRSFWALVWGTVIMVVTGFILWFPKLITSGMPSWIIGVARTIHFYEALLATLAILLFHFYFTMFHPDEYPMNPSWMTGKILEKDAEHHFKPEAIETMRKFQDKKSE